MNTLNIPPNTNIDEFLRANRKPTRFVLGPGTYLSYGSPAFADLDYCMLAPGCELIGAGPRLTDLMMIPAPTPAPTAAVGSPMTAQPIAAAQVECLTAGSRSFGCEYVAIRGLTVRPVYPAELKIGVVGIHVWSDASEIRDVAVTGITGVRTPSGPGGYVSREGFGVLVNAAGTPGNANGAHCASNVTVTLSNLATPEHYVCGFYIGVKNPTRSASAVDIAVVNPSPSPAHAAFGTNGRVFGSRWSSAGRWNRAIFCDVDGGSGASIEQSRFSVERVGVEFRGAGVRWEDITVRDSLFVFEQAADVNYSAGLVLAQDGAGTTFDNVRLEHCTLRARPSSRKIPYYLGSADSDVSDCGLRSCSGLGAVWEAPQLTTRVKLGGFLAA